MGKVILIATVVAVVGCSSTPPSVAPMGPTVTIGEHAGIVASAYCAYAKGCDEAAFTKEHGTEAACREKFIATTVAQAGGDPNKSTICTREMSNQCGEDTRKLACSATAMPASCSCS
jgi:hypothetical protein